MPDIHNPEYQASHSKQVFDLERSGNWNTICRVHSVCITNYSGKEKTTDFK